MRQGKEVVAGVFDSGVGGLTVAKSIIDGKLFEKVIYYGDTARVPYGTKDKNTIIRYALEAVEFFKNFHIDLLIVACNTVSSYALDEMRKIAPFSIVGVIEPGVLSIMRQKPSHDSPILVIGTKATIASGLYQTMLQERGFSRVIQVETGLLVPLVEDGIFNGPIVDAVLAHYFSTLQKPAYVVLGCTHFPLISQAIQAYFPAACLVHSGEAIVEYLHEMFNIARGNNIPHLDLFASSSPDRLKERAADWLSGSEYQ